MSSTLFSASAPVFIQMLDALSGCLGKAADYCETKKIDPLVLTSARLYPDMAPMTSQIQIATDHAKGSLARLAGIDVPAIADTERTFDELKSRIAKTVDFVKTIKPAQLDGADTRNVNLKLGPGGALEFNWPGSVYLFHFALPNFYFHITTAYDILRHNGVEIGKRDFVGRIPGM